MAIAQRRFAHHGRDLGEIYASNIFTGLAVAGALCLALPLPVEALHPSRPAAVVLAGVLLQMFVTTGARFVRTEALVMIVLFALFLAAQFMGFGFTLP